jgi:hypothetical protein
MSSFRLGGAPDLIGDDRVGKPRAGVATIVGR